MHLRSFVVRGRLLSADRPAEAGPRLDSMGHCLPHPNHFIVAASACTLIERLLPNAWANLCLASSPLSELPSIAQLPKQEFHREAPAEDGGD